MSSVATVEEPVVKAVTPAAQPAKEEIPSVFRTIHIRDLSPEEHAEMMRNADIVGRNRDHHG